MRFLLLVLPFLAAVSALPLSQPVVRVSAKPTLRSLIHRPEIGTILRRIPELDVSQVIAELNASCHGALPTLPASVVPQIQRAYDIAHGGAEFVGNHPVIADFVAKVAGFNWGGGHGEKDAGLGGGIGSIGDYELPTWLMELIEELIKLFDGRSGGQTDLPIDGSTPPAETATTTRVPPTGSGTPITTTTATGTPIPTTTTATGTPIPTTTTATGTPIPTTTIPGGTPIPARTTTTGTSITTTTSGVLIATSSVPW